MHNGALSGYLQHGAEICAHPHLKIRGGNRKANPWSAKVAAKLQAKLRNFCRLDQSVRSRSIGMIGFSHFMLPSISKSR